MKLDSKLHNLDTITIIVKGKDGTEVSETIDINTINERINSVLYQTFNNALGRTAFDLIKQINTKNLPDNKFFNDLQNGIISNEDLVFMRYSEYYEMTIIGNEYYEMTKDEFYYNKKLAEQYLNSKK